MYETALITFFLKQLISQCCQLLLKSNLDILHIVGGYFERLEFSYSGVHCGFPFPHFKLSLSQSLEVSIL